MRMRQAAHGPDSPSGSGTPDGRQRGLRRLIPGTIRGKLFLVFAVITLSAAVGVVVAQRANVLVQTQVSQIAKVNLPSLVTAHEISTATTNVRNVASAMVTAESDVVLARRQDVLRQHIETAQSVVSGLDRSGIDPQTARELSRLTAQIEELTAALALTVGHRLGVAGELRRNVRALASEHLAFNDAIRPLIIKERAFLDSSTVRVIDRTENAVGQLNVMTSSGLIPVLSINAQVVKMKEALRNGAVATSEDAIDLAWGEFVSTSSVIGRNIGLLERNQVMEADIDIAGLSAMFEQLLTFGTGDDSVFELRRRQLQGATASGAEPARDLDELFREFERFLQFSTTLIRGEMVTVGADLNREVSDSLTAMNRASIDGYGSLLKLEALGNRAVGILTVAAHAGNIDDLKPLGRELATTHEEFDSVLARMNGEGDLSGAVSIAQRMMGFSAGERNLLALRADELNALDELDELLSRTNALTQQMSARAADIVTAAQARADESVSGVVESLRASRLTLALSIALSLIAILGAIIYVNRSLGSRLSAFSSAALALAEGDLRVKLPEPAGQDELSRLMRALVVFRDTAAEMEQSNLRELREARLRLDDAIESIQEGFVLFDAQDRLLLRNRRYAELLYDNQDVPEPGATYEQILREAVRRGLIRGVEDASEAWITARLASHRETGSVQQQQRSNGRWIRINERHTSDGGTVVTYSDITALQERQAQLEEMDRLKSGFLSSVSHELRTPLTSVRGFAKLIKRDFERYFMPVDPDPKLGKRAERLLDNIEIVKSESERLTRLINDVLDLSKIETGAMTWSDRRFPLRDLLETAFRTASGQFAEKPRIVPVLELPDTLPEVEADYDRLFQVVINLVNNAVKFTDSGRIVVSARIADPATVEVAVTDTGPGIPPEECTKIFDRFHQATRQDTLSDKPTGTGLGLSICKQIIEHYGGQIWVESVLGEGSRFLFTLPSGATEQPRTVEQPQPDTNEVASATRARILVVEDDRATRRYLRHLFEDEGHVVEDCADGAQALPRIRDWQPDLISMDLNMPGVDGRTVIAEIRDDPALKQIPIIVISGFLAHGDPGANASFDKPVDEKKLLESTRLLLSSGAGKSLEASAEAVGGYLLVDLPGRQTTLPRLPASTPRVVRCTLDELQEKLAAGFTGTLVVPADAIEELDLAGLFELSGIWGVVIETTYHHVLTDAADRSRT